MFLFERQNKCEHIFIDMILILCSAVPSDWMTWVMSLDCFLFGDRYLIAFCCAGFLIQKECWKNYPFQSAAFFGSPLVFPFLLMLQMPYRRLSLDISGTIICWKCSLITRWACSNIVVSCQFLHYLCVFIFLTN